MKNRKLFMRRFISLICVVLTVMFCASCNDETHNTKSNTSVVTSATTTKNTDSSTTSGKNTAASTTQKPVEDTSASTTAPSTNNTVTSNPNFSTKKLTLNDIPAYAGKLYITMSDGKPAFADMDLSPVSYESYSPLDTLGRCGVAVACIGKDIMPTGNRGSISSVKPTGWYSLNGETIYNRSHLIAWSLTGENANKQNLITGTTYFNQSGMTIFENMVLDYIRETNNHVLYRVTPMFKGEELVARGVLMEAYSIEDDGDGICYNVFLYNVQDGVTINYATGAYTLAANNPSSTADWILNLGSKKIHYPTCASVGQLLPENKGEYSGDYHDLLSQGYVTCGSCFKSTSTTTKADATTSAPTEDVPNETQWVLNKSSKKIHYPTCSGAQSMSEKNKVIHYGDYTSLLSQGYKTCGTCFK